MWLALLFFMAAALYAWFVAMAYQLSGPIGGLVAFWGPVLVGLLLYRESRR